MNTIFLKLISGLIIIFVVGVLYVDNFVGKSPENTIQDYYTSVVTKDLGEENTLCDEVSGTTSEVFRCYTAIYRSLIAGTTTDQVIRNAGQFYEFPICHNVTSELERQACYFEAVGKFKNFVALNESGKVDYSEVIAMCKNFDNNPFYKLLCVRSIALKAVDVGAENLHEMCIENTATRAERIYCVVGFAHKLAEMVDANRGIEYVRVYTDICKVLSAKESLLCASIIEQFPEKTYLVSPSDVSSL